MSPRNGLMSVVAGGILVVVALATGAVGPLLTIPSWTAESDQLFANFGWAVAGAGDVNNDGYDDVIVGAVFLDNPEQDEGQSRVYLGGPGGLSATPAWAVDGNNVSANFGHAVSGAGDVNNDGYDDVIVGAPRYFNPEVREGRAFVYLGRIGGPSTLATWTGESNQDEANFGWSVAGAGDVDNDGYDDIVVGAPFYGNGELGEGRAYVYHGGGSGLSPTAAWMA
ncbi:MAG: integrin alpha [Candidatus Krumholzibacteriia bacterium]